MEVIELRNYRLQDGRTADFIRYFEQHFLTSQRDVGMHVIGQFAVMDDPERFVWIRGFADMKARRRGLDGFYDGAFWQARRTEANAMIRDHENVHLLRPLDPIAAMTGAASLDDRSGESAGVVAPSAGLIVVDFYRAERALDRLIQAFGTLRAEMLGRGHHVLGRFVAERAPNDYPRLPAIQDPSLLVVVTAYPDAAHHARLNAEWTPSAQLRQILTEDVVTLRLQPTARSIVRYPSPAPA